MTKSWKTIQLTQGFSTIISSEDYDRVKQHSWHVHRSQGKKKKHPGEPYARATINGKKVYLHRFIFDISGKDHIDHLNFDTLDNRRENLKQVKPRENILRRRNSKFFVKAGPKKISLAPQVEAQEGE